MLGEEESSGTCIGRSVCWPGICSHRPELVTCLHPAVGRMERRNSEQRQSRPLLYCPHVTQRPGPLLCLPSWTGPQALVFTQPSLCGSALSPLSAPIRNASLLSSLPSRRRGSALTLPHCAGVIQVSFLSLAGLNFPICVLGLCLQSWPPPPLAEAKRFWRPLLVETTDLGEQILFFLLSYPCFRRSHICWA